MKPLKGDKLLLKLMKYLGMTTNEAVATIICLNSKENRQEMLLWIHGHPNATPQEITQESYKIAGIPPRDAIE